MGGLDGYSTPTIQESPTRRKIVKPGCPIVMKSHMSKLQRTLDNLNQEELDRYAAASAEKKRLEHLAAVSEKRRNAEELKRQEAEAFAERIADRKRHEAVMAAGRSAEAEALKAATAAFFAQEAAEQEAVMRTNRVRALRDGSCKLLQTSFELQHGISKKFGVMMVTKQRVEMLQGRPNIEKGEDTVGTALTSELQTLTSSREELQRLLKEAELLKPQVEAMYLVFMTNQSRENVANRLQRCPSAPALGVPAGTKEAPGAPVALTLDQLMEQSEAVLDKVWDLARKSVDVLARTDEECSRATAVVTARLDRRKTETDQQMKDLRILRDQALFSVRDAEKKITALRRRAHRIPSDVAAPDDACGPIAEVTEATESCESQPFIERKNTIQQAVDLVSELVQQTSPEALQSTFQRQGTMQQATDLVSGLLQSAHGSPASSPPHSPSIGGIATVGTRVLGHEHETAVDGEEVAEGEEATRLLPPSMQRRVQHAEASVASLRAGLAKVEEELTQKSFARNIDKSCQNLTKVRAGDQRPAHERPAAVRAAAFATTSPTFPAAGQKPMSQGHRQAGKPQPPRSQSSLSAPRAGFLRGAASAPRPRSILGF